VDSELGPIPEGWEVVNLGDIADINRASIRKNEAPEHINYVTISSVSPGRIEKVEPMAFEGAPGRARRIVKHGAIIWSTVRPNRRSYCLILDPVPNMIVSTGFAVITARTVPYTYLYHALTTDEFVGYLTNHATGAAYPAVSTDDFEDADVLLPPSELLALSHRVVLDFFDEKQNLHKRNGVLRCTRDLLLPRLIPGEVDVSDLGIDTGGLVL
jgi:type I restriction enzyme S subunit